MGTESIEIRMAIQIQKPAATVFEAIVDPEEMTNYFISKSSGRMEEGRELKWSFPEFDMEFPIQVGRIVQDQYVSYTWEADGEKLLVEMTLESQEDGSTVVTVTEKSRANDEAGLKWLMGDSGGWANFLACLKAYLEYGINLRKGAFEFMRGPGPE